MKGYDFSGYVTKANVTCTDGRVISPQAFEHQNGAKITLVYQHIRDKIEEVIGHVFLEHRNDGMYGYAKLNQTKQGQHAKEAVRNGDLDAFSIFANMLKQEGAHVMHGFIREVSLVLSGANPEARIDNIAFEHADGTETLLDTEAVMNFFDKIEFKMEEADSVLHSDEGDEDEELNHADDPDEDDTTVAEVIEGMTPIQKRVVYSLVGLVAGGDDEEKEMKQSTESEEDNMKTNTFDATANGKPGNVSLQHAEERYIHDRWGDILRAAHMPQTTLRSAFQKDALEHAGTYGIDNIGYMFPDAQTLTEQPAFLMRKMEWVSEVIGGARHLPFSRIRSLYADITPDEARARGYVTGNQKVTEVFELLKRETYPTTVYKSQKLDRDDVVEITDFNVVAWLKAEMRMMLNEELAKAILLSDLRSAGNDKISETAIRPIYKDVSPYNFVVQNPVDTTVAEFMDSVVTAFASYHGAGNPTMFVSPSRLSEMLLLRDSTGRRIYNDVTSLALALQVGKIVRVPLMENIIDDIDGDTGHKLDAIVLNMNDYAIGSTKGGKVSMFDDFDIDFNQYKYLIETRCSGALTKPNSAMTFQRVVDTP
jgi:HK97 family phage prohead protease